MENCPRDARCLICRRVPLGSLPKNSENPVSNASLLQDFLNCFHINVIDTEVSDLSTTCQFCPSCEHFIAEWSSIQTQMTQLTRRAAQLEATLSALLLSAPQIHVPNLGDDVTENINNRVQNCQDVELPLLLQQTVHDIRNQLRKKYSVSVMLDKLPVPLVLKREPLPLNSDNDGDANELWDHREIGADSSDEEYIRGTGMETEEAANCDDSNLQDSKETKSKAGSNDTIACPKSKKKLYSSNLIIPIGPNRFKFKGISFQQNEEDQTYTCDACGFKSLPKILSIRFHIINHFIERGKNERQRVLIPVGPNRFKYNGYGVRFNDEDGCYYCGVCNHKGHTTYVSTLAHIKNLHYTAEDTIKFTAVKTSDTEWLYGGKYQIVKVDEKKLLCLSCGVVKSFLYELVRHIRIKHVALEGSDEAVPLTETDVVPSANDLTHDSVHVTSDTIPLPPVLKLEPLPVDSDNVDEPWDHWECEANIQLPVVPKIEPLSVGDGDDDEPWELGADNSDDEYLPSEDELNDAETSEQILGMRMETEEEAYCDDSQDSVHFKEMNVKAGNSKTSGCPERKESKVFLPDGPKRFTYKKLSFRRNEENQTYTCDACGFQGPTPSSIFSHLRIHMAATGKGEYRPIVIPDGTNRFKYNGYDVRFNDEDNCYYCCVCDFNGYGRLSTVLTHIREIHYTAEEKFKFTAVRISNTEWLYGGKYKIIKMDDRRFKCASCGSLKYNFQQLVAHIRSRHAGMEGSDEVVSLPVADTPSVNDLTPIQGEFESVRYTVNPTDNKYTCGSCETQLPTWNNLVSHIRQSHIRQSHTALFKKFPCEICGTELSSIKAHRMHMKRHQTGPMKCPTCSRQFVDKRSFDKHMKLHELGEEAKKYQCEVCGKKFLSASVCKKHQRLHTSEMSYECQVCGDKFRSSNNLTRHRQIAHGVQPKSRRVMKVCK